MKGVSSKVLESCTCGIVIKNRGKLLTAKLFLSHSFPLLFRCFQSWRAEVGHDHEELLEANLLEGAHLILMLVPRSQTEEIKF